VEKEIKITGDNLGHRLAATLSEMLTRVAKDIDNECTPTEEGGDLSQEEPCKNIEVEHIHKLETVLCESCHGAGRLMEDETLERCEQCSGRGRLIKSTRYYTSDIFDRLPA